MKVLQAGTIVLDPRTLKNREREGDERAEKEKGKEMR